jgi:hypothetical protein
MDDIEQIAHEVTSIENAIKLYLDEVMPKHPEWDNRTHAEEIANIVFRTEDKLLHERESG